MRIPSRTSRAHTIAELRAIAKNRLPRSIFDFFDGGAEDEISLRDNEAGFGRLRFAPHVLNDVSKVDMTTPLLGLTAAMPLAIAPTGGAGFGRPGSDIAIAMAAAAAGIPYTLSTTATASIERVAREAPGRLWFQAYILRDKELLASLIDRAFAADYEALMITVDLPVGGKRERDLRNCISFPLRPSMRTIRDFAVRPAWILAMLRNGMPVTENLLAMAPQAAAPGKVASFVGRNYDPSFNWDRLSEVRERWPRKLIVKGVLRADDAVRLAGIGADAIVVSNHGGRQLDGAIASIDTLPDIARAVSGKAEVWIDGGIRRGGDIMKALALGAQAALIGRATLFGAFAGGRAGAARALEILADEFGRAMQLCGTPTIGSIGSEILVPRL
jgi:(S)-mandelate dehydrogenase